MPDGLTSEILKPDSFTSGTLTPEQYRAEINGIEFTPDSLMSSSPELDNLKVRNPFSLAESFEREEVPGSEPIESTISSEFLKPQEPVNYGAVLKKVLDKPENPEIKTSETPKKAESKTQKTLFDF